MTLTIQILIAIAGGAFIGWFASGIIRKRTPKRTIEIFVDSSKAVSALEKLKGELEKLLVSPISSEAFYIPASKLLPFYVWLQSNGHLKDMVSLPKLMELWGDFLVQEAQAKNDEV